MSVVVGGGRVVTPGGVIVAGQVVLDGGRIGEISDITASTWAIDIDARGGWIVPGFIDVQVNGAYGINVASEPMRIGELGGELVRSGVTAFVPTVTTSPPEIRARALAAWADVSAPASEASWPGAVPLGLHFEGPMISAVRRGAHPERHVVSPSLDVIDGWSPAAGVVLVTMAPELPGALDVIAALADRGVVVSLGHTDATATEFAAGVAAGARYVTHLYNAMRPFGHRDPGPIGAALADDTATVGLICDGVHVDPVAVRVAWRALGARLNLVSDAVAALGVVGGDAARTPSGVLAGSVTAIDQGVRNLVAFTGCSVPDALATVTSTPADLLGLTGRGRLVAGARADVTVLDDAFQVVATIVGGRVVWQT